MTDRPEYSIAVLCHNRINLTDRCLHSVLAHSPGWPKTELIVIDNGSNDGTDVLLDDLRAQDRRVKVYRNRRNRGVIGPKNRALDLSTGAYFVSLDNDCTVGAGWLEVLRQAFKDPKVAQVGRRKGFGTLSKNGVGSKGKRVDYIDGSCFMVRSDIARLLGLCDPAFEFAYCEDSDFSLRLRKRGWRIALADAPVRHAEHGTAHHAGLNLQRFWRRNHRVLRNRWQGYIRTGTFGHPEEP